MDSDKPVVVVLASGKSDNGKNATLAFSCAMSAQALGQEATVFLTSDGAVWGYAGSAEGITVQGFPPLTTLIEEFQAAGGQIMLCSVCHKTCSAGSPGVATNAERLPGVAIAGFTSMLEIALQGVCVSF